MIRRPPRSTLFPYTTPSDLPTKVSSARTENQPECESRTFRNLCANCISAGTDHVNGFTPALDRKSTRLNSSHSQISYAVFCLKKKKQHQHYNPDHDWSMRSL